MLDAIIENGIIVTMENDCEPFVGSIGIKDGKFVKIGSENLYCETAEKIDATNKIIFPGMINGHVHGDMTVLRGLGDDLTLLEQNKIFEKYGYFINDFTIKEFRNSRELTYVEALKSGTTFILEHEYTSLGKESINAFLNTGIKGAISNNFFSLYHEQALEDIKDKLFAFIKDCKDNDIVPIITGRSEEFFDLQEMQATMEFCKENKLRLTQHFAETDWRMDYVKEHFASTSVKLMSNHHFLNDTPVIGSHCIHIDDEEIKLLVGTKFSVFNTPLSEMKISDGIAPIRKFIDAKIPIGLGTDGALWNNSNDMFREIKGLILLHNLSNGIRNLDARTVLEMATIGGAKALNLDNEIGSIKEGKQADFILVRTEQSHMQPLRIGHYSNVLSMLAYCATGSDVESTYIRGKAIVKNGICLSIDEKILIKENSLASERILNKYNPKELLVKQ